MTVASIVNTAFYAGNGITNSFPVPFYFQQASDLLVETYNPVTLATITLVLNTDYTISPALPTDPNFGWPNGAAVITSVAVATGLDLNIYRNVQPLQPLNIPTSGPFPSHPIEHELDRAIMAIQDDNTLSVDLAVKIPLALEGVFNPNLPAGIGLAAAANTVPAINSTSDGFIIGPSIAEISAAAANAAAAAADAAAAAASAAAAAAAASSVDFQVIQYLTSAASPITIDPVLGRANAYIIDATAGNVIVNLPHVSGLLLTEPFNVAVKKNDSSGNTVTINAFSGDNIDSVTSLVIGTPGTGTWLSASAPTNWTGFTFGTGLPTAAGVSALNSGHIYLTGANVQTQLDEADAELVTLNAAIGSGSQEEHAWEGNGPYYIATFPLVNIDSIFFAPRAITINSVWIYNGSAGASGTTSYDLRVASPGGAFTSILSTLGTIDSTAASGVWTDSGSAVPSQTGVVKPVISTASIAAGRAISFYLTTGMAPPATDARIRIFYN